mmetsp:Transcript_95617/g.270570  ORF Transcript_95617/g.270570 Transcript_95617/m.270570 type:complete len:475 (+) Transcript_95617:107-1531(+)
MLNVHAHDSVARQVEVIPSRLYWVSVEHVPKNTNKSYFFSVDDDMKYEPYNNDFGPLDLSKVYRYCQKLETILNDPCLEGKQIVHCCSRDPRKRANAACLICLYCVAVRGQSADEAFEPFKSIKPAFRPFRDAGFSAACAYQMTIHDCLAGMEKAIELGWFSFETFDVHIYEELAQYDSCGLNWIIPDKFIALAGPTMHRGWYAPDHYVPLFCRLGVKLVVRLNEKQYKSHQFTDNGIGHAELMFEDGSCPPAAIVSRFLSLTEAETGAIAVHCMAGLGRTCTLIALYAMKHFKFPARAVIAWNRLCRPGSIIGPQQQFIVDMQGAMFQMSPDSNGDGTEVTNLEAQCAVAGLPGFEDKGQGERLCRARGLGTRERLTSCESTISAISASTASGGSTSATSSDSFTDALPVPSDFVVGDATSDSVSKCDITLDGLVEASIAAAANTSGARLLGPRSCRGRHSFRPRRPRNSGNR